MRLQFNIFKLGICPKKQFLRTVKRIIFNGTEHWRVYAAQQYVVNVEDLGIRPSTPAVCSHFQNDLNEGAGGFFVGSAGIAFNTNVATLDEWKQYVANQYANGTPLEVVCVMATPEVIDISDQLTADNFVNAGTITFKNPHSLEVPSEIIYQIKEASV